MSIKDIQGIVAVNDAKGPTGAIVWWRLSGTVEYDELRAKWLAEGLDEGWMPRAPTAQVAMRRTANDLREKRVLVRPLGRNNGFAVVRERVNGKARKADGAEPLEADLSYEVLIRVTLDGVERIVVENVGMKGDMDQEEGFIRTKAAMKAAYQQHLNQLAAEDFSPWLARLMPQLDAVSLRDQGGVYFVPPSAMPKLEAVVSVLRKVTAHTVNRVPAMRTNEAVEAILDAITQEAEAEATRFEKDLAEEKLGEVGMQNRANEATEVEAKLVRYEEMLGVKLEVLRERLLNVRTQLTVAALKPKKVKAA